MITLKDYQIDKQGMVYYITIPFDKDSPLLKVNFDVTNAEVEADGKIFTVVDCLESDNGEWLNLVCNRIFDKRDEERKRIGQRIAQLRSGIEWVDDNGIKRKGMTQTELASRCGLSQVHITRVERGAYSVRFDNLQAIADALCGRVDIVV